jgi:protein O-mannosyl-transferase
MAVLLMLVTVTVYWPVTGYGFVDFDDQAYVTENSQVQGGLSWQAVTWAFLNPVCCNWHPLTVLSHMLVCQVSGLNPWGHHLTNVLLHALNSMLVFMLLRQMTGATWRSLLVAALFAVHPLHVESVAWVSERKDVLSGCFGLLALMAYARYARGRMPNAECRMQKPATPSTQQFRVSRFTFHTPAFYLLSLLLFSLGLMSKPMLVTLPFVMLLLDYWPLRRLEPSTINSRLSTTLRLVAEKIPFFALAVVLSVLTFVVQRRGGSLAMAEHLPLGARLGNALISYGRYLGKLFWPTDLAVFYPHPGQWPTEKILLATGLILGICVLLILVRRRYPFLLVGWLWFCGMLVPMIGLVQTGEQAMADRHTYAPAIGVIVALVWGLHGLAKGGRYQQLGLSVAGSMAIVLCLALTRQQLGYWQNSETLFRHALEVTENNYLAHKAFGDALDGKGQMDEAVRQYREALRLKPAYPLAHNNLANTLAKKGQIDEAIRQYQEALRLTPGYVDAHFNLGNTLLKEGQIDEAIRQYQEALGLKPDYAEACNNLGAALDQKGQTDEAIRQYREAIRLKPANAGAHNNLGFVLSKKGQTDEAIRQYQEAIRLKPDYADARKNIGLALGKKNRVDEAINQYQEALRLQPADADAHYNFGNVLYQKGRTKEAIRQYQEAVRLKPEDADAHNNFGAALERDGQTDEAITQYREALRLKPDYTEAHSNLARALEMKKPPEGR